MSYRPGNGVGLGKVLVAGLLGTTAIAGLGIGLGVEGGKNAVRTKQLADLNSKISVVEDVTRDINVTPPKGFIN